MSYIDKIIEILHEVRLRKEAESPKIIIRFSIDCNLDFLPDYALPFFISIMKEEGCSVLSYSETGKIKILYPSIIENIPVPDPQKGAII